MKQRWKVFVRCIETSDWGVEGSICSMTTEAKSEHEAKEWAKLHKPGNWVIDKVEPTIDDYYLGYEKLVKREA